jgi:5-methylcytosine-specific restriction endonuclease McrA
VRLKVLNEGCCRVTGRTDTKLDAHHLVERSQGGSDDPDNIMPLANDFHVFEYHQGTDRAGAARRIRAAMTSAEEAYVIRTKGETWLNRRYPR